MGGQFKIPKSEWDNVVKRYKECESTYVVAKEYGVCHHTIMDILIKRGVPRTGRGNDNRKISRFSYPAIVERYKECENVAIIAKEYGVSYKPITRILIKMGVERIGKCGPKVGSRNGIILTNTTKADHLRTLAENGYIFEI